MRTQAAYYHKKETPRSKRTNYYVELPHHDKHEARGAVVHLNYATTTHELTRVLSVM